MLSEIREVQESCASRVAQTRVQGGDGGREDRREGKEIQQTDRQKDRQTDRQTGRQTDRQTGGWTNVGVQMSVFALTVSDYLISSEEGLGGPKRQAPSYFHGFFTFLPYIEMEMMDQNTDKSTIKRRYKSRMDRLIGREQV